MDIMVIAKRFKSFLLLIFSFKSDRVYNKYNNTYRTVTMLWYTFSYYKNPASTANYGI